MEEGEGGGGEKVRRETGDVSGQILPINTACHLHSLVLPYMVLMICLLGNY